MRILFFSFVLFPLLLAFCQIAGAADKNLAATDRLAAQESLDWQVLGRPTGDKQPAARKINELKLFGERLYIGHGDYGVNTGPTDLLYYDFEKKEFVNELKVQEEAITVYRVLDGKLVVPGVDSTESWDKGNLYVLGDGGWIKYRTVPFGVHVFDAVAWRDRWFVASSHVLDHGQGRERSLSIGAVLSSANRGETWRWAYTTPSEFNGVYRIHRVVPYQNHLYAFAYAYRVHIVDRLKEEHRRDLVNLFGDEDDRRAMVFENDIYGLRDAMRFDGVVWKGVDLFPETDVVFHQPFVFKDSLCAIVKSGEFVATAGHYALADRGWPPHVRQTFYRYRDGVAMRVALEFTTIEDIVAGPKTLYLLVHELGKYRIAMTSDLENWQSFEIPDKFAAARSLEIGNGQAYVGANDGSILTASLPQPAH